MSVDEIELFDEEITREEVEQKAAPGSNGLTAEMVSIKELVHGLLAWPFNWCWTYGMAPSEWRKSVIVPIPKK